MSKLVATPFSENRFSSDGDPFPTLEPIPYNGEGFNELAIAYHKAYSQVNEEEDTPDFDISDIAGFWVLEERTAEAISAGYELTIGNDSDWDARNATIKMIIDSMALLTVGKGE